MNEYIFYIFSIMIFFILVRETIIDIKTMYVPDNITFAIYTASVMFLVVSWFTTNSFNIIKDGLFGFLLGFGVPFVISLSSYLIQLFVYKNQKKKGENQCQSIKTTEIQAIAEKEDKSINTTINDTNISKKMPVKRIFYWLCCFVFLFIISAIQTMMPQFTYLSIGVPLLIALIISYEKTKKIEFPIYLAAIGILVLALYAKKDIVLIPLTIVAIVAELILAQVFQKFYKIEIDVPTEEDNSENENIEGGIGGGDILIFGALGLMFGLKGVITILLYSLFSQLLIILSYALLSSEKSFARHIPFVPGIVIGTYLYVMGFDLLNLQQILSLLWRV
jgi:Flp pilus assembly protein protease CpaA